MNVRTPVAKLPTLVFQCYPLVISIVPCLRRQAWITRPNFHLQAITWVYKLFESRSVDKCAHILTPSVQAEILASDLDLCSSRLDYPVLCCGPITVETMHICLL